MTEQELNSKKLSELLHEHYRHKEDPRIVELSRKYPKLLANDAIYWRLRERYPGSRMTDQEYKEYWAKIIYQDNYWLKMVGNKKLTKID